MMSNQPRLTCVIDPALALTQYGLVITQQLAQVMDLWITREFWYVLDNPTLYQQHPELITPKGRATTDAFSKDGIDLEVTLRSLTEWEKFYRETDLSRRNLFWIGDNPEESYLPRRRTIDIFQRWERIAQSLDCKIDYHPATDDVMPLFIRDTVALAASLGDALILTHQRSIEIEQGLPPYLCQILEHWDIPCQAITINDASLELERNILHALLVQTNTAKFLWTGVHLVIVHVLISETSKINSKSNVITIGSKSCLKDEKTQNHFNDMPINPSCLWYFL